MSSLDEELECAIEEEDLSTTEKLISVTYDTDKFKTFLRSLSEKFTYLDDLGHKTIDLVGAFNFILDKREKELNATCNNATKKKLDGVCDVCKINYGHRCSECDVITFINNDLEDVLSKIYDYEDEKMYHATLDFIKEEIKNDPNVVIKLYNDQLDINFYKVANLINKFDLNDIRYKDFNIIINSPLYSPLLSGVKEIKCNRTVLINL